MNKGFSLVELIVVIAIMAILVGVAVPVYTSYIGEANEGVEKQYADELERAVNTAYIDLKAGLTKVDGSTTASAALPASVTIVGDDITVTGAAGEIEDSDFEAILTDLFTLDAESDITFVFTFSNGVADVSTDASWAE